MAKFYAKAPDGTDATLSITVEGFTQSLQQNGWCKMPNGLILQWRLATVSAVDFSIVYFPINFINIARFCTAIHSNSSNIGYFPIVKEWTYDHYELLFIGSKIYDVPHTAYHIALGY